MITDYDGDGDGNDCSDGYADCDDACGGNWVA